MSYAARIKAESIRLQATEVHTPEPKWMSRGGTGWRCTLRGYGKSFTVTMWMGPAHNGRKPEIDEVLETVLSDAAIIEEYDTAVDFARAMGYTNGREAENTFKACVQQTERLKRWLGDRYSDWLYETANV